MKLTILLTLCLFYVATTSAQTINLTDLSDSGNPFELSGTVSITGSKADFAVQGKNVSGKDIILYRVELVGVNTNDHDYYFQSHSINSGDVSDVFVPTGVEIGTMVPLQALDKPQIRVVYVQFGDGSDWGNKAVGMSLRANRPILNAALKSWLSAYESGGDAALKDVLEKESTTSFCRGIALNVINLQKVSGTDAAVAYIEQRLDSAKIRQAAGIN